MGDTAGQALYTQVARKPSGWRRFWSFVFAAVRWLTRKVIGPTLVVVAWCAWVWFSGRTWRHQVPHHYVRRQVRAVGNWVATLVGVLLVWQPLATAAALAVAGIGLMALSAPAQRRALMARRVAMLAAWREPAEVQVTAGPPIRGQIEPVSEAWEREYA